MKNTIWKLCLWNVILLSLFCRVAAAQEEGEEKEDPEAKKFTRVTVRGGTATPGQKTLLPIYMTPAEGTKVGRLKLEVTFVSANMKFEKVERGLAAEMGNVELKSEMKQGKNDKGVETTTVTLQTSFSSEPPEDGIPGGVLAYITLQVSDQARPAVIALHTVAEVGELGTNKPLKNLRIAESNVQVFAPGTQPAISCFFFSH